MSAQIQNLSDITDLIKRRKHCLIISFLVVFLVSAMVAFFLPSIYKSTAVILIEGQQIPPDFVQSTVHTVVEEVLQTINYRIMSRTRLLEIINQFNLYDDLVKRKTTEEVIERMREDININAKSAEIINERTGRSSTVTIAFELSYQWENPKKVEKVANILTSLYLEQNLKIREEKARSTSDFMEAEIKTQNNIIDQLEKKVAEFKKTHFRSLPEMANLNLQMFQKLEVTVENIAQQIKSIRERKIYLEGQLAGIDPDLPGLRGADGLPLSPKDRLKYFNTSYITTRAFLSEKHPDLIKLKKEINSLEKEVAPGDEFRDRVIHLKEMKKDLAGMEVRLTDKHPDLINLKKSIKALENEMGLKKNFETIPPENPAYLSLVTQIETAKMEIETLKKDRERLKLKLNEYEKRLGLTPQIELEYKLLTRDYENARFRYQDTLNKLMLAKSAEGMEKGKKGQKFTVIDAPTYPEKPYKPNRLAIILIGVILALGTAVGVASLKEFSDQAIRSDLELSILTKKPVLTAIPDMETREDRKRKRRKNWMISLSSITGTALFVLTVHLVYEPLDVLWFRVLRKLVSIGLINP